MKNLKSIIVGALFLLSTSANAQVTVNVNLNPPSWGPSGYTGVRYYYIPDVQAYYDIQTKHFIYLHQGNWIHRSYLPTRYKGYNLYGGYKVVMRDYRGNTPHKYYNQHKVKYAKGYKGKGPQKTIGSKPGQGKPNAKSPSHHKPSPTQHKTSPAQHKASPGKGSPSKGSPSKGSTSKGGHSNSGKGGGKKH